MNSPSRWKHRILYLLGIGAVLGGILYGVYSSAHHVPEFYREALVDPSVTVASAEEFQVRTSDFMERLEESGDWTESFTERQINSWLAYEFPKLDVVPEEVSQPRIRFQDGSILAACRYEGEDFSGVLILQVRPKVTEAREPALELVSAKAGLIPISRERILQEFPRNSDLHGWSLDRVESDGREALLISCDRSDDRIPKLTSIDVEEEQITIRGESDPAAPRGLTRMPDQSDADSELSN